MDKAIATASPNWQYLKMSLAVRNFLSLFGKMGICLDFQTGWAPGGQRTSLENLILQLKIGNFLQENK